MLSKLTLTNWQCHKNRVFAFGNITVLVGDNDAGKSAVMRALRWLTLNEWDGEADSFVTWGEKTAAVEARIDNKTVTRSKGGGVNLYKLGKEEYKAFGVEVPQPIRDFLKIDEDNFQSQLDPAFWLMLNPGQAAQALNNIFNLTTIDNAVSYLSKELFAARSKVKESQERLNEAEERLAQYAWVDAAEKDLSELERLDTKLDAVGRRISELEETLESQTNLKKRSNLLKETILAGEALLKVSEELLTLQQEEEYLNNTLRLHEQKEEIAKTLKIKEARLKKLMAGTCPLCGRGA